MISWKGSHLYVYPLCVPHPRGPKSGTSKVQYTQNCSVWNKGHWPLRSHGPKSNKMLVMLSIDFSAYVLLKSFLQLILNSRHSNGNGWNIKKVSERKKRGIKRSKSIVLRKIFFINVVNSDKMKIGSSILGRNRTDNFKNVSKNGSVDLFNEPIFMCANAHQ